MDQARAPYFDALQHYLQQKNLTFHVPGHQHGKSLPLELATLLREFDAACDITEVLGMDDIHNPHCQVQEAQELAAQAFGARRTQFLVGGSTVGNQAMFLANLGPEDLVLLPPNCHRSVFSALLLCGARAQPFLTDFDEVLLTFRPPTPAQVKKALESYPQARAVFLTTPTYHGLCAEVEEIVALNRSRGVLTLVDEAWGAHLAFHSELPISAVAAGADMVCQSTHKLLPGLTQTAMLHYDPRSICSQRVEQVLRSLQTSSPSSLLVASLDCARRMMVLRGEELLSEVLRLARRAREVLSESAGINCLVPETSHDPTRLILDTLRHGYIGHSLAESLRYRHSVQVEMSEVHQVLLLVTLGHSSQDLEWLLEALRKFPAREPPLNKRDLAQICHWEHFAEVPRCTVREAFFSEHSTVKIEKAVDQTSAELLYCYPPGVPVVIPGQRLSQQAIDYIKAQKRLGGSIQGGADADLRTIRVVSQHKNDR